MSYFKYLPNVYIRDRSQVNGNHPFQLTKNIFRRIKIRDDLQGALLGFVQYEIGEGERPDQIANVLYGDPGLDWVVLLCNNIINVYDDWPMTREQLYAHVLNKYGSVDKVSHYETYEIKTTDGIKVLDEGLIVNESFQFIRPDGTVVPKADSRKPVTYYELEAAENEKKRNIFLLREGYVNDFVKEFKKLAAYLPHGEMDVDGNKKTPTTLAEEFIGITNYRKPSQSTASTGSASGSGSSTALISSGGSGGGTSTGATIVEDTTTTVSTTPSTSTTYGSTSSTSSSSSSSSSSSGSSGSSSGSSGSSGSGGSGGGY